MSDQVETQPEQPEQPKQSTNDLISQGTKAFWLRDYKEAVSVLGQVSEMLAKEHGDDKHDGLGNVYMYYGKSLLELAREAGDPLGEIVPKEVAVVGGGSGDEDVDDESGDEDGDHEEEEEEEEVEEKGGEGEKADEVKDAGEVKKSAKEDSKEAPSTKGSEDTKGTSESADISMNGESASTSQPIGQSSLAKSPKKAKEGEEGEGSHASGDEEEDDAEDEDTEGDKEEEEEPSDLQVAWEVLELAKEIFTRRGDSGREDYAECLITLGEVSMESENFDSAIADIKAGLAIQLEIYTDDKDMRKLAHSNYMMGMAYYANNNIAESMECYKTTLSIIKKRLALLEAIEAPGASDEKEIAEVKSLIPEVEEKIADLQNYAEECAKKKDSPEETVKSTPPSSPEKKATNISHLVKRKREEGADADAGNACKKPAPAPASAPAPAPAPAP